MAEGLIDNVPVDPMEKAVPAARELISKVPAEIGGEAVRAEVEIDEQACLQEMARADQTETVLTPATVKSVVPPTIEAPQK
ncbi:MAG: hypothetical protein JWO96_285 [Candidatus Saccharibacteria bacterium]|nr:hypothetical protein [Candidatus Saccharibacteria bacterium]